MDPYHLDAGWVGFDFSKALGGPVKIANDAAMQALGSHQGGRMLVLDCEPRARAHESRAPAL